MVPTTLTRMKIKYTSKAVLLPRGRSDTGNKASEGREMEQEASIRIEKDKETKLVLAMMGESEKDVAQDILQAEQRIRPMGKTVVGSCLSVHSLKVFAITLANCGDNAALYIPLYASYTIQDMIVTTIIFLVLLAVWIILTSALVSYKAVAEVMDKYGEYIVPWALIGLGIYVLYNAHCIILICPTC